MKRVLVLGMLLLGASFAIAMTNAEIRCSVLGMGGGGSTSPSHTLRAYQGPLAVGVSVSPAFHLTHGPVPCAAGPATGVGELPDRGLPAVLRIHQNTPNPFNPVTTIAYELPRDVPRVHLRVYDLGGRLVRTLVNGPESAGKKSVVWNGRDEMGRSVSSGVYLYELAVPERRLTRKMTLLK